MDDDIIHKLLPPRICQACLKTDNENEFHEIKETMRYFTHFLSLEMDRLSVHWLCRTCHKVVCESLTFADRVKEANQQLRSISNEFRRNNEVSKCLKDESHAFELKHDTSDFISVCKEEFCNIEKEEFIEDIPDNSEDDYQSFEYLNSTQQTQNKSSKLKENGKYVDNCFDKRIYIKLRKEYQIGNDSSTKDLILENAVSRSKIDNCERDLKTDQIDHKYPFIDMLDESEVIETEKSNVDDTVVTIFLDKDKQKEVFERKASSQTYLNRVFKCKLCFTGFSFKEVYVMHLQRHSESCGIHECDMCHLRFEYLTQLKAHAYNHSRMYQCSKCDYRRFSRHSVINHYEKMHKEEINQCNMCGKCYGTLEHLKRHVKMHNGKKYECCHCGRFFTMKQTVQYHIRKQHMQPKSSDTLKHHKCDVCGKSYEVAFNLKMHKLRHHSGSGEFYCVECDSLFKTPYDLRNHLENTLKHANPDTLIPCTDCPLKFIQKAALKRHIQLKHSGKKKPFKCELCPKTYYLRAEVTRHRKRIHEGIMPERKYVCSHCGKSYMNKVMLTSHQNTHTGERPHVCGICGATFAYKSALFTHNQLVHLKIKRKSDIKRSKMKNERQNSDDTV